MPRPYSRHRRGDFHPAQCVRSGHNEELIDLGADDIPGYGRIYLCIHCAAELIQALGYIDPDVHNATVARIDELQAEVQRANVALTELTPNDPQTEEMARGIRAVLDRFVPVRLLGGSTVSALLEADAGLVRAAGDSAAAGDRPAGAGGEERAAGGGDGGGDEPPLDGDGNRGGDGGAAPAAGAHDEADDGDGDGFFGWLETDSGADGDDAAERDDRAGD